ncbi:unnamed protein product [Somion occarium]
MRALHALSQTSRALREYCLPRAWERLEACIEYGPEHGVWYKQVSNRLRNISNGLAESPELAQHVQIATVSLTRCSVDVILPAFTRCLERLPNLHTLQIVHAHSQMSTALKDTFESKRFPQIRTIILPSCAQSVLRACPEVRHVTCNEDNGGELVTAILASCKKVEILRGITPESAIVKHLSKAAPHLRELGIISCAVHSWPKVREISPYDIRELGKLTNLSNITIMVGEGESICRAKTCKAHIQAAFEALEQSTAENKSVTVRYSAWISRRGAEDINGHWQTVREEEIAVGMK